MQLSLVMAEQKGRFLFEIRPDIFPAGYLTEAELTLWARHYENKPTKQTR